MAKTQWGLIIGGSIVIVALIGWDEVRNGVRRIPNGTTPEGAKWQPLQRAAPTWEWEWSAGPDADGVQYGVEAYEVRFNGVDSCGNDHEMLSYRAARSAGTAGGFMAIAGGEFNVKSAEAEAAASSDDVCESYEERKTWAFNQAKQIAVQARNSSIAAAENPFPNGIESPIDDGGISGTANGTVAGPQGTDMEIPDIQGSYVQTTTGSGDIGQPVVHTGLQQAQSF